MYGVNARGIAVPNVLVGVLVFFGGICQFLAGIMEFISGNTVSCSYIMPHTNLLIFYSSVPPFSHPMELSTYRTP